MKTQRPRKVSFHFTWKAQEPTSFPFFSPPRSLIWLHLNQNIENFLSPWYGFKISHSLLALMSMQGLFLNLEMLFMILWDLWRIFICTSNLGPSDSEVSVKLLRKCCWNQGDSEDAEGIWVNSGRMQSNYSAGSNNSYPCIISWITLRSHLVRPDYIT